MAEQPMHLAGPHVEPDIVERHRAAEPLAEVTDAQNRWRALAHAQGVT